MIKVEGLSRAYGNFMAVDDISFVCKPGTVTGFLGPNGAGKTTTMRVMVGLTSPTAGEVTIGGMHFHDIPNPGRHVGVLLDASAQHAGRTGREVLTIGAKTMGLPMSRVDEMLALVSLDDTESKRRVRNYSLGMRQRLGIAHALLGDPSVLILDEPANGLDPAGIRWMRGLLKGYADRGGTVLLSSHLLNEVEQIADEMLLIGRGKIVARGTKAELLAGAGGVGTLVVAEDNDRPHRRPHRQGPDVHAGRLGLPRRRDAGRRRPPGRRAVHRAVRPPPRGGRPGGPVPRAHLRHPARGLRAGRHHRRSPFMSTATSAPMTLDVSQTARVPFSRLVSVELRKMFDTRAGRWLLISIAAFTALVLIIQLWVVLAQDQTVTFEDFAAGANIPMNILLPVLGVMSVTSEWSQRTAMVTFTLEPSRTRFLAAKFVGTLIIALAAVVVGFTLTIAANGLYAAFSDNPVTWDLGPFRIFCFFLLYVFSMATGFAFGMLLLNTAAAIVVYFVYSFIFPGLFELGSALMDWFKDLRPWIDFANAQNPIIEADVTGKEWAQLAVSGFIWLVLPLVIGVWRVLRAEVK